MAMGLPVVVSDVGGLPEAVGDPPAGVLVPVRSPERLAAAIDALLSNPEERLRLGRAARERSDFSLDSMAAGYEAL